jgi:hypothetical protein
MKWFADNSELNGIKGAEIPDILLFGGLIASPETEKSLRESVEAIKRRHAGHPRAPIKWNMKDLKGLYKDQGKQEMHDRLMQSSRQWRSEIFECIATSDCSLLIACIEGYSSKRTVLKEKKDELTRFIFTNGLMRFGLHVRDTKPAHAQVVLDWPDRDNSKPFDSEYARAFSRGSTVNGQVNYSCGKLGNLPFCDSVMYTTMHHSTLLQVADLIVGATREFIECSLGKKDGGQGVDCLKLAKARFRGAPNDIIGRGIVVPSGNSALMSKARKAAKELLNT